VFEFVSKVLRKKCGAIAVFVNSEPNNIIMSGADATIMIPAISVSSSIVRIIIKKKKRKEIANVKNTARFHL
jgi:UDP-N-acetylmuramyl pentapeptide phosphotransferase/UDP-N-acetylglucosamine-1-phosphate transferase